MSRCTLPWPTFDSGHCCGKQYTQVQAAPHLPMGCSGAVAKIKQAIWELIEFPMDSKQYLTVREIQERAHDHRLIERWNDLLKAQQRCRFQKDTVWGQGTVLPDVVTSTDHCGRLCCPKLEYTLQGNRVQVGLASPTIIPVTYLQNLCFLSPQPITYWILGSRDAVRTLSLRLWLL